MSILARFEKELKNKISLKCSGHSSEETVLIKAFKYFDLDNSGQCSEQEFLKAISKIGITGFSDKDILEVFKHYDADGSGEWNYKEFVGGLYGNSSFQNTAKTAGKKAVPETKNKKEYIESTVIDEILSKIRAKWALRGVRGIVSIGRNFKIIDDDNSHHLDFDEFRKASKDFRFGLTDEEVEQAFRAYDRDDSGHISYDEFLRAVRGNMNPFRRKLVKQAFDILDTNGNGQIELEEIKEKYNARYHPDVKAGKRTEDEVLMEFLETFELAYNNWTNNHGDGIVTIDEFMEYYENVSMSIDDDAYFELMMNNAWKMNTNTTYNNNKKGWSNKSEETNGNKNISEHYKEKPPVKRAYQSAPFGTDDTPTDYGKKSKGMTFSKKGDEVILKFRAKLAKRGTNGLSSIRRAFMIADDDNSKTIDAKEFHKFCRDYRMELTDEEVSKLFTIFDKNNNGTIDYDEFISGIVGEMNAFRRGFAEKAFKIMDKNGNGVVEIDDIRATYSARKHPDVISGRKTEDEIFGEFLETFEFHYSLLNSGKTKDHTITLDEWLEYYNNISMSIDTDEYFKVMMTNAWNLDNKPNYGKGWKGE